MKRTATTALILCLIVLYGFGQTTIPNGHFENFVNLGTATEEPQYWHSNKDGGGWATLGPQTCYRDTSSLHGGTYCVKMISGSALGNVVNGSCTTGQVEAPTTNKADGFIRSESTNSGYLSAFTGRPDSLVFWYKYTSVSSDYPTVEARLHIDSAYAPEAPSNGNHPNTSNDIISRAVWQGAASSVGTWTRVSVPFTYVDGRTPQYILITTTSSGNQTGGSQNSTLWLDEMSAIYNPTIATGTVSTGPFYINATTGSALSVPFILSGFSGSNTVTAQLSNSSGSFASPVTIGSMADTVSGTVSATIPANTASGSGYRVRVVSSNPVLTAADNGSNIQVVLTSTSVTPSTAQSIGVNTNGAMLTVNETPAATSRQWLYATTSGGAYQAFGTTQTGTTYTPNFAGTGTYYIVCVSSYPGSLNDTSNAVQVNVDANSIAPTAVQSILTNTNGATLTVTETPSATSRLWEYSTTSGGTYTAIVPNQTGTTYTPNIGTAGTYYVVCVSSFAGGLSLTSNEVQVNAVENSIAPSTTQNILAGVNGATLTVTETPAATSRQWEYSTSLAGPYSTFTTSQTGTTYTPNFNTAGTYYVICISTYPGPFNDTSNVVQVNVVQNSIAPSASQSLLVGVNGNTLTVTETPSASSRQWKSSGTTGGPYNNIGSQTATTYTPNFGSAGTYYVVCVSVINGVTATSNEVLISVGNATLATGTITGSPYLFSAHAPDASVTVPYTTSGTFNGGNVFTAQLSDAAGSFNSPVDIGNLTSTGNGSISATILHTTSAGAGYRIRVVSSNPLVLGSDNGVDLVIDRFNNSVAPGTTQALALNTNGTTLTVTASQTSTQQWKYTLTSGSGYAPFGTPHTGTTYTPNFNTPGTYFVVCVSTNQYNDSVTSNEVEIDVQNGNSIVTQAVSGSPFNVSAHASVPVNVDFTSNAVFTNGNVFTAQLSDRTGSFASPVNIGTLAATSVGTINATIPDNSITGTHYRIRVVSSNPAITGSNNGTDLVIDQFSNSVAPGTTQTLQLNTNGNTLTVTPSQTSTQQWKYATTTGGPYFDMPSQTGTTFTPNFAMPIILYIVCTSTNQYSDSVTSNEVEVDVLNGTAITTSAVAGSPYYVSDSAHVVVNVNFTSTAIFSVGNVFTAQLSDNSGSFASPVSIGAFSSDTIGAITAVIPNNSVQGTNYRIRVVSNNPAITGSDNGADLTIIPFIINVSPSDTQHFAPNVAGAPIVVTSSQPATYLWKFSINNISYNNFSPVQTGDTLNAVFTDTGVYYIMCTVTNNVHSVAHSQTIVAIVENPSGINEATKGMIKAYWSSGDFVVDLSASNLQSPVLELINIEGQKVVEKKLATATTNRIATNLPMGVYVFRIYDGQNSYSGKVIK